MSKFNASGIAANIEGRNCRNLESGQHHYIRSWNYDLHIYTVIRWQLLNSGFLKRYRREQYITHISICRNFLLPECDGARAAANIEGRSCRNLESCHDQFICRGYFDLPLYAIIRKQLRQSGFFKHYNR